MIYSWIAQSVYIVYIIILSDDVFTIRIDALYPIINIYIYKQTLSASERDVQWYGSTTYGLSFVFIKYYNLKQCDNTI